MGRVPFKTVLFKSKQVKTMRIPSLSSAFIASVVVSFAPLYAQGTENQGNYKLAKKYSSSFLKQFSYSTSVSPQWIGESNRFWYSYRTSAGTKYWLVDSDARTKTELFDHGKVAGAITEATEKAVDAKKISVSGIQFEKNGKTFKFNAGGFQFEYHRTDHSVKKIGKAPRSRSRSSGRGSRTNFENMTREEITKIMRERNRDTERRGRGTGRGGRGTGESSTGEQSRRSTANRSYTPDKSAYVYAKDHNLYYVEGEKLPEKIAKKDDAKSNNGKKVATADLKTNGESKTNGKVVAKTSGAAETTSATKSKDASAKKTPPRPRFKYNEESASQLSTDGVEDYSFGGVSRTSTRGNRENNRDRRNTTRTTRSSRSGRSRSGSRITWSEDSTAFYTTRRDSRGLKDLFLVNSIADPRPSLQTYKYPMPGEERVRTSELHYFSRNAKKLTRVKTKWQDESYQNVAWHKETKRLRFMRRDRLLRHVEYCSLDPMTGKVDTLFSEGSQDGYLKTQSIRAVKDKKEFIWWSERTGWGHFYLYGEDGKLKNPISSGAFRASRIVSLDDKEGVLYFRGNGREPGENIYYEHLYRVRLDGTGLTLLDPGNATHRSSLSPSKRFVVDNSSRVDQAPGSALRDAEGNLVMKLEECDLTRLREVGWKMPETFTVKAGDGVTNLYGNMWKPFDFDPKNKYPIIVHVYPGPQQEGVTHTFSASSSRQQLAQIGFIVIQVGHRGGTPKRSRAYANYGYYNLRDYGLADKQAAIEQLAMRHSFIDVEQVGIYGHSGGGFMTAAALMQKPYNDFFKVGVSSAGNHDNNIYNNSWSERYHGLKEVAAADKKKSETETKAGGETKTTGTEKKTDEKGKTEKKTTGDTKKKADAKTKKKTDAKTKKKADAKTEKKTGAKTKKKAGGETKKTETGTKTKTNTRRQRSTWRERLAERQRKEGDGGSSTTTKSEDQTKKKKFEIKVPTNAELAENLKGHLLLVHGEIDNNVHPANTMRLVDALIKANKRFDMLIIPGARHGFGRARDYFTNRMWEYFAEHLLGDRQLGADIGEKSK